MRYLLLAMVFLSSTLFASSNGTDPKKEKVKGLALSFSISDGKKAFGKVLCKFAGNGIIFEVEDMPYRAIVLIDESNRENDQITVMDLKDKKLVSISKGEINGIIAIRKMFMPEQNIKSDICSEINSDELKETGKVEKIDSYKFKEYIFPVDGKECFASFSIDLKKRIQKFCKYDKIVDMEGLDLDSIPGVGPYVEEAKQRIAQTKEIGIIGKLVVKGEFSLMLEKIEEVEISKDEFSVPADFHKHLLGDLMGMENPFKAVK